MTVRTWTRHWPRRRPPQPGLGSAWWYPGAFVLSLLISAWGGQGWDVGMALVVFGPVGWMLRRLP